MEVRYRRNFSESYMVIEAQDGDSPYEEQMLRQNEIKSLLTFHSMEMNHSVQFWYNITGLEALRDVLEKEAVSLGLLKKLVEGLAAACDEMQKYLLKQDHIRLEPDTVFIDRDQKMFRLKLCYCPAQTEDLFHQFQGILEFILTFLGEDEERMSGICCGLYDIALQENYTFDQLLDYLNDMEAAGMTRTGDGAGISMTECPAAENAAVKDLPEGEFSSCAFTKRQEGPSPVFADEKEVAALSPEELPLFDEDELALGNALAKKDENHWQKLIRQTLQRAQKEMQELREVAGMLIAGKDLSEVKKGRSSEAGAETGSNMTIDDGGKD